MPPLPPQDPSPRGGLCAVDLFSGLGGLTEGLRLAGFRVAAAIEEDELAVEAYRANHPGAWVWQKDVRRITPSEVLQTLGLAPGELPLLAGCPPCEGFSRLRSRNGRHEIDDPRNALIAQFTRFVKGTHPWAVMLENVPALRDDDGFASLLRILKRRKYSVVHEVLDAADFGVPQRRKRLILIGSRMGPVSFPEPNADRVTVAEALAHLPPPGSTGDPVHDKQMRHSKRIRRLIESVPPDGGGRMDLPRRMQLDCHRGFDGFRDVYGRMSWNEVSPTITGGCASPSKGRFLHPEQDRVISLREAALLQSFPEDYVIPLRRGRYAAAELIGNALPPEMIRRLAEQLYHGLTDGDVAGEEIQT